MQDSDRAPPDWNELFLQIAVPRGPGSVAVSEVQNRVSALLDSWGFRSWRQSFSVDSRRLRAGAVLAAGWGWAGLLSAPLLLLPVPPWVAVVLVLGLLSVAPVLAFGLAEGHLPTGEKAVKEYNVVARSGDEKVRIWLVCHSDSKTQGISLAGRLVAIPLLVLGVSGVATVTLLGLVATVPPILVWMPILILIGAAAALSRGFYRGGSPGAVDNASGIIGALAAAHALKDRGDVGFLMTGAEEFGMAGARVWISGDCSPAAAVNFDGLDSRGRLNLMPHPTRVRLDSAQALLEHLTKQFEASGWGVRVARLPWGVFVDGAVLARGGVEGCTVSKGDWRTLQVIHTSLDRPERVEIRHAARVGELTAAAVSAAFG